MSAYRRLLNPYRRHRESPWIKGTRQTVVVTNKPSTISPRQQLLVRLLNLSANDVIIPETELLAFIILLDSQNTDRSVVQNIGRAIVHKHTARLSGNVVFSLEDSDVYFCYMNLWKTSQERENGVYQGIDTTFNRNVTRLGVDAGNADTNRAADVVVAGFYKNRFFVPLDFSKPTPHFVSLPSMTD